MSISRKYPTKEVNELLDRAFQEDREQATPAVM